MQPPLERHCVSSMVAQPVSILRLTHSQVRAGFMNPHTSQQPRCNHQGWWTSERSSSPGGKQASRLPPGEQARRTVCLMRSASGASMAQRHRA